MSWYLLDVMVFIGCHGIYWMPRYSVDCMVFTGWHWYLLTTLHGPRLSISYYGSNRKVESQVRAVPVC